MKVEILNEDAERIFEPVELNILIESKEELLELWCTLGLSVGGINGLIKKEQFSDFRIHDSTTTKLWETLHDIVEERDIDP